MIGTELGDAFDGIDFLPAQVAVMRDGVRLVADVYRPQGNGPWPVLLMRQPYGRDIASTVVYAHPTWWARQGFLVVIQDVRGRGDSEGEFYPFRFEKNDGHDTVAWAAALKGSNGRVGMYGFSYQASTQLLAALSQPPALKALAPHMTAFDLYSGWFYRDGILQLSTSLAWANQMLREDAKRRGAASYEALEESYLATGRLSTRFPIKDVAPLTADDLPTYAREWLQNSQPGGYWKEFDLLSRVEELKVPMFHLSGWYDLYLRGSVDGYEAMQRAHPDQFLLASPWIHLPWGNKIGTADLGPQAVPDVDRAMASWFHHYLDHDRPVGPAPLRGTRYFVLGKNQWRDGSAWPPPEAKESTWFLRSQGRANSRFGDGTLSTEGATGPDDLFNYDPEVPIQAPGGNLAGSASFGPHDLSAQQQGINMLVYTSPSLANETVIAGRPRVLLHFRSSAPSTHVVVRLSRVTTDGRAQFLTLGAAIARASEGQEIEITLDPIAASFGAGEAIRLDIASSAFPLLIRHPNTDTDPCAVQSPAEFKRALQIVYHNAKQPSRLILPVLSA
ncbi:MAG TPA: CocE/NonD family hydrolase [Opitutaceae bacterium]|nr:CocE/NonD family hydrolase [Opitutaceae bacterium]